MFTKELIKTSGIPRSFIGFPPPGGLEAAVQNRRLLDSLPGAAAWSLIVLVVALSFAKPLAAVLLALSLQFYWCLRGVEVAYYGIVGYRRSRAHAKIDWKERYRREAEEAPDALPWDEIRHIVIVPNYKEPLHKLEETLRALAAQDQVARNIHVVLAMEAKDGAAEEKARLLREKFESRLGGVHHTIHPAGLPGELPGKSSNEAWAGRWAYDRFIDELGGDPRLFTMTSCDADSVFHPKYFSYLTYRYALHPKRDLRIWQAPLFFHNNAWKVPAYIRFIMVFQSIGQLASLAKGWRHNFPISTYSAGMNLFHGVGNWDPDIIPEDWHMYLKCFFHRRGGVEVEPVYLFTSGDAPEGSSLAETAVNRYTQAKRHAWGITDFAYAMKESIDHSEIPFWAKAPKVLILFREHLFWSTSWFVVTLGFLLPLHLHPEVFQFATGRILEGLYHGTIVFLAISGPLLPILDYAFGPPMPAGTPWWRLPSAIVQWNLLPVVLLVFVALPALHAQTRLMLGKGLAYEVTRKM